MSLLESPTITQCEPRNQSVTWRLDTKKPLAHPYQGLVLNSTLQTLVNTRRKVVTTFYKIGVYRVDLVFVQTVAKPDHALLMSQPALDDGVK